MTKPFIFNEQTGVHDGWNDPIHGRVSWHTLFSGDITPSEQLSGGIARLDPGGELKPHRHDPAEIYFVLEGTLDLTVDGTMQQLQSQSGIFIPGNAEHGCRNNGTSIVRFLYVFAVDRFSDVLYRFPETGTAS